MTYSRPTIPFLSENYSRDGEDKPIVVKRTPSIEKLSNVVSNYKELIAPPEFQRPESWVAKDKIAFFKSLLMDRIEGALVIVNIKDALYNLQQIAVEYGFEDRAILLLKSLQEQGYKYIALDGNNRFRFLFGLINNTYSIPEGTYEYIRSDKDTQTTRFKVRRNKNTFNDLPQAVKDTIKERRFVISEYTQIG